MYQSYIESVVETQGFLWWRKKYKVTYQIEYFVVEVYGTFIKPHLETIKERTEISRKLIK
jgi:hypothetical protein